MADHNKTHTIHPHVYTDGGRNSNSCRRSQVNWIFAYDTLSEDFESFNSVASYAAILMPKAIAQSLQWVVMAVTWSFPQEKYFVRQSYPGPSSFLVSELERCVLMSKISTSLAHYVHAVCRIAKQPLTRQTSAYELVQLQVYGAWKVAFAVRK